MLSRMARGAAGISKPFLLSGEQILPEKDKSLGIGYSAAVIPGQIAETSTSQTPFAGHLMACGSAEQPGIFEQVSLPFDTGKFI